MNAVNKFLKSNKKYIYGFNKKINAFQKFKNYLMTNNQFRFNNILICQIQKNKINKRRLRHKMKPFKKIRKKSYGKSQNF